MRLILTVQLHQNKLPIENRRLVLSYLKHAMEKGNPNLFHQVYDGGAKIKDMVFSTYFPIDKFEKDVIHLKEAHLTLRIGTSNLSYGIELYNVFQGQLNKEYSYQSYGMTLKKILLEPEKPIFHEAIHIKMQSPLLVRDKEGDKDMYLLPDHPQFEKRFQDQVINQLEQVHGQTKVSSIHLSPIKWKKIVTRHYGQYIDGALGTFILEGQPSLLTQLYHSGVGARRSYGFGMFEIL